MSRRILTDAQVIEAFGDPMPWIREDGTVGREWEARMTTVLLPKPLAYLDGRHKVTRIRCHVRIAGIVGAVYADLAGDAVAWASIGDFGGCYVFRLQRRSNKPSRHSWGIALDQDCADNPFGRAPKVERRVLEIFDAHGFAWGGTFGRGRTDGMHFEFADLSRLAPWRPIDVAGVEVTAERTAA